MESERPEFTPKLEESEENNKIKQRLNKIVTERDTILCDMFFQELLILGEEVGGVQDISNEIKKAFDEGNESEFVDKSMLARDMILHFKEENPFIYENLQRRLVLENGGNMRMSELMYCNRSDNKLHIHIGPKGNLDRKTVTKSLRDGFHELIKFVSNNPDITEVVASSWIVYEHPKIFIALGFTLDEVKPDKVDGDGKMIQTARISRDKLIHSERTI